MNTEVLKIAESLKDAYDGDPWFGKSMTALLSQVDEHTAFEKYKNQHSILELVEHIINWRLFVIRRLRTDAQQQVESFEVKDWQPLDHTNKSLWLQAMKQLHKTQIELIAIIDPLKDELLDIRVAGRDYTYRKLLNGIIQHDIYHLGQIAYISKLLKSEYK